MSEVVVVGLGQLGRLFAGCLLRSGHAVIPVNRGDDVEEIAAAHPAPALVLLAVGEADLSGTSGRLQHQAIHALDEPGRVVELAAFGQ